MPSPSPLDRTSLRERSPRSRVAEHRRLLRAHGRAARTPGQRLALLALGAFALVVVALPPAGLVVAATTDDPDRRSSALAASAVVTAVLGAIAIATVATRRARARANAGPALLGLAHGNGLSLTPWRRRDVAGSGSPLVHVTQVDLDVLHDADGVAWGTTTIHASGGRRIGVAGRTRLAIVEVPLGRSVPHVLLRDERGAAPSSIAPDAIDALELVPATPRPWRVWTTEPHAALAAGVVDDRLLLTLERHAPGLDVELVGDRALLTSRVDSRWRADDDAWLDVVDGVRMHVAPALRAAASALPAAAWAPLPDDEPLARSLRLALARRARRDALVDGALDVAGSAS